MHRPCTSHKAAAYCEWKRQLKLCVGLQQNIGALHTVHAHHAHTHACTHTDTHAHTITELTLPLSNGEHPLHYGHNAMNVRPEQGMGALTGCKCDSHCESESPHPGMWEGELGSKGIPLM